MPARGGLRGPGPIAAMQAVAGLAVAARLARGRDAAAPLRAGAPPPPEPVSVVIPARDEQDRLAACLDGLRGQPGVAEILVVDDGSTDSTAAVARDRGARVLTAEPPPPGWVGKPWALQQGLEAAGGPWIVTLDADTRPRPGLIPTLVAAAEGYDLLTAGGRYECPSPVEQALHASMLASLVYRFGPPGARRTPSVSRTLASGQCTVLRRADLLREGGFRPAAGHLSDDIALARHLVARGRRVGLLDASAVLGVDMHDGVRDAWRQWGRTLAMGDVTPTATSLLDLATWTLSAALPALRAATGRATRTDAVLLAMRVALTAGLRTTYDPPRLGLALSPLADPAVAVRLALSLLRPTRDWRGRHYPPHAAPGPGGTSPR